MQFLPVYHFFFWNANGEANHTTAYTRRAGLFAALAIGMLAEHGWEMELL